MEQQEDTLPAQSSVLQMLQSHFGTGLSPEALAILARDIRPYLCRSRLPIDQALLRIATSFLRDGARVRELLAARDSSAWQAILMHVMAFARTSTLFPESWEATSWPDLDAYEDIRERLPEYNFEGSLDAWIAVVITSRLRRYWRDSHALRSGGGGFTTSAEREAARAAGAPVSRVRHFSLEHQIPDTNLTLAEALPAITLSVAETVESTELFRMVGDEVDAVAAHDDPLLATVWHAVVDDRMRLREAGESCGLTVSQAHRRMERVRDHLRRSPQIQQWLERSG